MAEIGCNASAMGAKEIAPGVFVTGKFPNGRVVVIPTGPDGVPYWGPLGPPEWDRETFMKLPPDQ